MAGGSVTVDGVKATWIDHASVVVEGSARVYVDPWSEVLTGDEETADVILVTHPHFDHFDAAAIDTLSDEDTFVVLRGVDKDIPQSHEMVDIGHHDMHHGVEVKVVPAYNEHRFRDEEAEEPFHPKDSSCGYVFTVDDVTFYHAGDTDNIEEMEFLQDEDIDVAFLPIGGTYTMDVEEAVEAAETVEAKIIIPIHYGFVDGTDANAESFKRMVEERTDSDVRIL